MPEQRSADQQLSITLNWNEDVHPELTWDEVESEVGYPFPTDYKRLMSRFPSGDFGKKFYIYSPVQGREWLARFNEQQRDAFGVFDIVLEDTPDDLPYPVFPAPGGLLPWGLGDEEIFCWQVNEVSKPDDWTVVFGDPVAEVWGEYPGPASNFLLDVILGNFTSQGLYYKSTPEKMVFKPYGRG